MPDTVFKVKLETNHTHDYHLQLPDMLLSQKRVQPILSVNRILLDQFLGASRVPRLNQLFRNFLFLVQGRSSALPDLLVTKHNGSLPVMFHLSSRLLVLLPYLVS